MPKKRGTYLFAGMMFALVVTGGCAYTLRYTITSRAPQLAAEEFLGKTYFLEGGSGPEDPLHGILRETLSDFGWGEAPKGVAVHIVRLNGYSEEYREEESLIITEALSGIRPYDGREYERRRSRRFIHTMVLHIYPAAGADSPGWNAVINTKPVQQRLLTVAKYMIPEALSYYPREGIWELRQDVYLHAE